MGAISHIEDHYGTTVKPRILEQYRGDTLTAEQKQELGCDTRWQACLKAVIDRMQVAEDASFELASVLDFTTETPTGSRLDWLAGLVNVKRNPGENDSDFFTRFVGSLGNKTAGTPDNVIYNSAILAGDPKPQYMDEADCAFLVYTGPKPNREPVADDEVFDFEHGDTSCSEGADQLYARQVRKLAPCGVLGLVGAAINVGGDEGNEELLADEQGRIILMEADDSTVERDLVLADNNGNVIVTPQSVPIRAVVKGANVPTIPVSVGGHQYDGVRIMDLPDAGPENGFFVRDSKSGGTVKAKAMEEADIDELWENTPAEDDENDG